jgi:hypothetical protein
VRPDGSVYRTKSDDTFELVGGVDASRFSNPKLLKKASVELSQHYAQYDTATKKWFKDAGGAWHHVRPDGSVYRTVSGNTFELVGGVDASRFDNPSLMKKVTVSFDEHYSEYDSGDKKWFKDLSGTWHHVRPDGAVYRTKSDDSTELVGGVDASRFGDLNLMKKVSLTFGQHYPEHDKATKKWFKDAGGTWHHVTPEGAVYRTLPDDTFELVGGVGETYFSDPNSLVIDH